MNCEFSFVSGRIELSDFSTSLLSAAIADTLAQVKADVETITDGVAELTRGMKQEQTRLNAQENLEVIEWLSPLNFWVQQTDIHSRAQEGTGKWLLDHQKFKDWVDGKCETLWCPGMPGAGKTVLASIIIEYLQTKFSAEDVGIAWLYFNYNEHASQTTENLMSSLLVQLVQRHPVVSDEVINSFRFHRARVTRPSTGEYVRLLQLEIRRFTSVYFVIDALDECPTQDRRREKLVSELQRLQPGVRLLLTSRPLHDIRAMMPWAPNLEIRANSEDVVLYLEDQIQHEARLQRHIKDEPSLHSHIIAAIVQSVEGMYVNFFDPMK
jgi:ankyrin repeat domain-containing protein 50